MVRKYLKQCKFVVIVKFSSFDILCYYLHIQSSCNKDQVYMRLVQHVLLLWEELNCYMICCYFLLWNNAFIRKCYSYLNFQRQGNFLLKKYVLWLGSLWFIILIACTHCNQFHALKINRLDMLWSHDMNSYVYFLKIVIWSYDMNSTFK